MNNTMNEMYYYGMADEGELDRLHYVPTIPEFLEFLKTEYSDLPAVSDQINTYSYVEFVSRVRRRVGLLRSLSLPAGANIAILAGNDLNTMELFTAIPAAGFTVVMLPASLPSMQLIGLLRKFDAAAVFAPKDCALTAADAGIDLLAADALSDTEGEFAPVEKGTPAAIFLTGGTTGTPKGAVLSHGALLRGAFNGVFVPGKVLHQTYFAMIPMTHVFGAIRSFLSCLYTGSLIYACPDMKAAITDIPVLRPTALVLIPGLLDIILSIAKLRGAAFLGRLRLVICGAAPTTQQQLALCREFGITVCPGYGLTECANLTSGNNDADALPESVGPVYPEQETKIVDGELWLRGDNVMLGYYGDPELTEAAFCDGWFRTGDLAKFVEYNGTQFLCITGRIKNLIILPNGENVSPEELEALFNAYPEVQDCLVRETEVNGTPMIGVEILPAMPGAAPEAVAARMQALTDEINAELPSYKKIRKVTVRTKDFKRSAAMKILRNQED